MGSPSSEIDVICIECGLFIRGEEKLKLHMATEHSSASSPEQQPARPISLAKQDEDPPCQQEMPSSSNQPLPQPAPPPVMDGAACCRFLTELFSLTQPQQHQTNDTLGESLLSAALMELIRKQQEDNGQKPALEGAQTATTPPVAHSSTAGLFLPDMRGSDSICSSNSVVPTPDAATNTPTSTPDDLRSTSTSASKSNRGPNGPAKRYQCEYCGKQFAQAPTLIAHRRIHTGEKPYKCHICNAAFKQVTHRNDHVNSHDANYRPFVCPDCGRGFARKYSLSIHVLIHKGIYRFQCSYCDKKFRQSADKKKHELRHTRGKIGERP